ncbi:nickel/cobalt transporter [Psychromonas sp. KJ10-10]|uniref:nickel/cobalt transporter n=1 Tax=Psychromonas sp. KJ10-10 TaxID=3391823 RepID=UPI0039B634C6
MQNSIENKKLTSIKIIKASIALSLVLAVVYTIWLFWPMMLVESIKWQRIINEELSNLLYEAKENPLIATAPLLGLSFVYGALHSIGPGHGKVIVTTFLATHPSKVKHSLVLTILSSLMQALVAILLVSALVFIFDNSMKQVNATADDFIKLSFLMVIVLGAMLSFRSLKNYINPPSMKCIRSIVTEIAMIMATSMSMDIVMIITTGMAMIIASVDGHQHLPDADKINSATTWQAYAGIIISIGIRPCTGAILALLFANMIGIYWLGILSALLMAVGTAMSTSTIALLTLSGKK